MAARGARRSRSFWRSTSRRSREESSLCEEALDGSQAALRSHRPAKSEHPPDGGCPSAFSRQALARSNVPGRVRGGMPAEVQVDAKVELLYARRTGEAASEQRSFAEPVHA